MIGQGNRGRSEGLWRRMHGPERLAREVREMASDIFFCVFSKVRNIGIRLLLNWHLVILIIIYMNLIG